MTIGSSTTAAVRPHKTHLYLAIVFAAIGFALLAPTRIDIAIILKEVMKGIGVTSLAAAGLLSTATLLGEGLTEMLTGGFSDRWGRMTTMVVGLVLYSIFGILTAMATALPVMYLVRILLGVGQAIFVPAYFAFIGGIYGRRRGLLLGSLGGLFTVGVALNPILTKDMFQATGHWQTPFIGYGIFGLIMAVCVYLLGRGASRIYETRFHELVAPTETHEGSRTAWIFNRNMILLLITMMFWGLTQYGFLGIFVTYLREQQHFTLGMAADVAAIGGWSAFAFSFVAGYVSDHIGRRWSLLIFGTIAFVLAAPIFVLPQTFVSAAILAAVFQACNGTFFPLGIAYAQDSARAEHLGVHTGAVVGIGHFVAGVAGLIVGTLAGAYGYASVGWLFTAASAVMVVAIAFTRDPRRLIAPNLASSAP